MEPIYTTPPSALSAPPGFQGNPWFTMWTKPRRTVRHMLDSDPRRHVKVLAGLQGIALLQPYARLFAGDYVALAWVATFLIGPMLGLLLWSAVSWLYTMVGQGLRGTATSRETRCALAWSFVAAPWMILVMLLAELLFMRLEEWAPYSGIAFTACRWILQLAGLWQIVISILVMAEAHRFGIWKSLAAWVITLLIFGLVLIILFAIFAPGIAALVDRLGK